MCVVHDAGHDVAPSVSAMGRAQTSPSPNIVTVRQALQEHIQLPGFEAAQAAGLISEE